MRLEIAARARAPAPPLLIADRRFRFDQRDLFSRRSVHVHGPPLNALRRGRKHEPAPLVLHKCQEILFPFYLELQCSFSLGLPQNSKSWPRSAGCSRSNRVYPCIPWPRLAAGEGARPTSVSLPLVFNVDVFGVDDSLVFLLFLAIRRWACTRSCPSAWGWACARCTLCLGRLVHLLGQLV